MSTTVHSVVHHDSSAAAEALKEMQAFERAHQQEIRRRPVAVHVAGRVLIAALFLISGFAKLATFDATRAAMEGAGLVSASALLPVAIFLELAGGLCLVAGFRVREVATGLAVYIGALTLLMHHDFSMAVNRAFATANLGLIGALLLLVAHGSGAFSADVQLAKWRERGYRA